MSELQKLLAPGRAKDESYEDYRARRLNGKSRVASIRQGTLIHNSRPEKDKKGVSYKRPVITPGPVPQVGDVK